MKFIFEATSGLIEKIETARSEDKLNILFETLQCDITRAELLDDTAESRLEKLKNPSVYQISDEIVTAYYGISTDTQLFIDTEIAPMLNSHLENRADSLRREVETRSNDDFLDVAHDANQEAVPNSLLRVTTLQRLSWKRFHEEKAVEAALTGNAKNLSALIDIKFVENMYEKSRVYMHEETRELTIQKIIAEEQANALMKSKNQNGVDEEESLPHILKQSEKIAIDRMLADYAGGVDLIDNIDGEQKRLMIDRYEVYIKERLTDEKSFDSSSTSIDIEEELRRLETVLIGISDKLSALESQANEINNYFFTIADPYGLPTERYFDFLMSNIDNKPIAHEIYDDELSIQDRDFSMPEPYRLFLKKLQAAKSLHDLATIGCTVLQNDVDAEDKDFQSLQTQERLSEQYQNEISAIDSSWNFRSSSENKARLESQLQACKESISDSLIRIDERVKQTALSFFKEDFCRNHLVTISPNFTLPDSMVEENNLRIVSRPGRKLERMRDGELILTKDCSLLEIAVTRHFYVLAVWLLLHGADPFKTNAKKLCPFHFLDSNDITGVSILAYKIHNLLENETDSNTSPTERALLYKIARDDEFIKKIDFGDTTITRWLPVNPSLFRKEAKDLSKDFQKILANDIAHVRRTKPSDLVWGGIYFRLRWLFTQGVNSFPEIHTRIELLTQEFRDLLTQLRNAEAVGHDENLLAKVIQVRDYCLVTSGYETFALQIDRMRGQIEEAIVNRTSNLALNSAVISDTVRYLIQRSTVRDTTILTHVKTILTDPRFDPQEAKIKEMEVMLQEKDDALNQKDLEIAFLKEQLKKMESNIKPSPTLESNTSSNAGSSSGVYFSRSPKMTHDNKQSENDLAQSNRNNGNNCRDY